jgi:hypothetical protein
VNVIRCNQEEHLCFHKFQLDPPSKPHLLDYLISSTKEWCNVDDKNNKYIIPIELWIEEACRSIGDLWNFIATVLHVDPCPIVGYFRDMKKVPTYS